MIVHLIIKLGMACEADVLDAFVLMCLDVGEIPNEGKIAAVDHDVLEDVGVAALFWDPVRWQILHLVQCAQTV